MKSSSDRAPGPAWVLPILLLVVLGLCTLGAGWLAWSQQVPVGRAARVLDEVRRKGLPEYWPQNALRWYLIRENDRPVGWRAEVLLRRRGGFEGLEVEYHDKQGFWEWWRLNDACTLGEYEAGKISPRGPVTDTVIRLAEGTISAEQVLGRSFRESQASAPPNYLPEGLTSLAVRLVAQRGQRATFKTVYNFAPPLSDGKTRLWNVVMTPASTRRDLPGARYGVEVRYTGPLDLTVVHYLDAQGKTLESLWGNRTVAAAGEETIRKYFDDAPLLLQRLTGGRLGPPGEEKELLQPEGSSEPKDQEEIRAAAPSRPRRTGPRADYFLTGSRFRSLSTSAL